APRLPRRRRGPPARVRAPAGRPRGHGALPRRARAVACRSGRPCHQLLQGSGPALSTLALGHGGAVSDWVARVQPGSLRGRPAPPGLTDVIARYPKSEFVDDATWYLAFSCYLLGKLDDTLSHLERLARMPGEYTQAKARYWKARVLERRGVTQPALEQYRALV